VVSFSKKDQQVVRLEPFARGMPGYAAMTEFVVQEYVKMFQEIIPDEKETLARYKDYLQSRTDPGLYQSFVGNELAKFAEARSKGVSRTVEVKGITKISEGLYQVEFVTRDFDRSGTEILNGELVATMRVTFLPQKVDFNARFVNPLGFTVQQYSVSKRR
jgi:type IV secretory pathway component VirB8